MKHNSKWKLLMLLFATLPIHFVGAQKDDLSSDESPMQRSMAFSSAKKEEIVISSFSSVSGVELEKTMTANFNNALIGRIPGLTVSQGSYEAGVSDNSIVARGISSFQGGNSPLILVDGFVCSIADLVPQEVESVTLLKDAAATSLYGLRGANGVLLVTTKRGVESPLLISLNVRVGFQQPVRTPNYLSAYDYANLYNEAQMNDGVAAENVMYSPDALMKYKTGWNPYLYPNVNWYKEMIRSAAPIHNYDLSFRGGDKVVKYFVLLNAINNNGLLRRTEPLTENSLNQSYTRYNVRSNVDVNVTNNFSAALNLGLSIADWDTPGAQCASTLFDNASLVPANAFPVRNPNNTFGGNSAYSNPLGNLLETGYYSSNSRTLNSSLKLTEKLDFIAPGLSLSGTIAFNSWYIGYSNKLKKYAYYPLSNSGVGDDIQYGYGQMYGENTTLTGDESMSDQWRNVSLVGALDYKRTFGKSEWLASVQYNYEESWAGNEQSYRHIGGAAAINYTYKKRYVAALSTGYQGSERFALGKQYGLFPAFSVGWVLSNEEFIRKINMISYLKLRASYGLTGNDEIGSPTRFMYEDSYAIIGGYPFGTGNNSVYGNGLVTLANPNVTWEKEKKINVGIDACFGNSLSLSADYYINHRYDILTSPQRDIPAYIGVELPMLNQGRTCNEGFELSVKYSGKISSNVSYYAEFQGWMSKNRVEYSSEPFQMYDYKYTTGRQIFQPYVLIADGFFTQADIDDPNVAKPTWSIVRPGDIKYNDKNKDFVIDENDSFPLGNTAIPKFSGALNLGVECYGFDLSMMFQGVAGRTVYLGSSYYKAFQSNGSISEEALGRWTEVTASMAAYPRLTANSSDQNNYRTSTFWQRDGSFIKLRNVELGYSVKLPRNYGLRIYVSGNDLFSLDRIRKKDPELLTGYPALTTYSLGAKFQF